MPEQPHHGPQRAEDHALAAIYAVSDRTVRNWRKLGAPLTELDKMPTWIAAQRTWAKPKPEKVRTSVDCRQMTPEEKRDHRCAQNRANYAKRCEADPTYRPRQNAAAKARYEAAHGPSKRVDLSGLTPEQRRERQREQGNASKARRKDDPAVRARVRERERRRRPDKARWRVEHRDDLNARRRAARLADPAHFRALEAASKKRRRKAKKAKKALEQ